MNLTKATTMCSVALLVSSFALRAGAQCPTAGAAPGCNEVITEGAGGTFTVVGISANGTNYDGSDDALVGFVNHTGAPVYSISLNGNGTDIFGFDGDGIDSFGVTTRKQYRPYGVRRPECLFHEDLYRFHAGYREFSDAGCGWGERLFLAGRVVQREQSADAVSDAYAYERDAGAELAGVARQRHAGLGRDPASASDRALIRLHCV